MIHDKRRFHLVEVGSVGQLVDDFMRHTWTLCTCFSLQGLLFLNDSFSEDGAQEYAVVRDGQQILSSRLGGSHVPLYPAVCTRATPLSHCGSSAACGGGVPMPSCSRRSQAAVRAPA